MELAPTPEQGMLKTAVRRFVQQEYPKDTLLQMAATGISCPSESWSKLAETGWLGIAIPQEYGGEGGTLTDAAVLFEELGRGPVPGPHISSGLLGGFTVLAGGTQAQKREWLPLIAKGERSLVLAVTEADYGWDARDVRLVATHDGDGYRLNGSKSYVFDGVSATHFLCAVRLDDPPNPPLAGGGKGGSVGLVSVPANASGVTVRSLPGFAWNLSEVKLDDVVVDKADLLGESFDSGWDAFQEAAGRTIPVLTAYQVGACQAVYDMSVEYSRTRVQFNMPIGRFQRVQDHVINLVNQLDAARWTAYEALWKLDTDRPAADAIHLAKAVGSEAYYQACNHAHEVHAGVGSMTEYGLTLHTTASRTLYHYLGDPRYHRRLLAEALGL